MSFAKRLGLVDFDGRPTQATTRVTRVRGVVAGAYADYPVINIQYTIKGTFLCKVCCLVVPLHHHGHMHCHCKCLARCVGTG